MIDSYIIIFFRIGHDNTGTGPGWHLDNVKVDDPRGESYLFQCKRWLDTKKDDGKIERTLFPDELTNSDSRSRDSSREDSFRKNLGEDFIGNFHF